MPDIPPLEGLEPIPDDKAARMERRIHDRINNLVVDLIDEILDASRQGIITHNRAMGLIQGTTENGRKLASLFRIEDPDFEESFDGVLRRRARPRAFGGNTQDEMVAMLRNLIDAQIREADARVAAMERGDPVVPAPPGPGTPMVGAQSTRTLPVPVRGPTADGPVEVEMVPVTDVGHGGATTGTITRPAHVPREF